MNSLFKDTIKINCPDEVLKIITCYAKALRAHDKVGKLLHLFPSGKQIEGWEKEAKEHKNMKLLREKIIGFIAGPTRKLKRDYLFPQMFRNYERIRQNRESPGIVSIIGQACGGCYSQLPPQIVIEIKKSVDIITCPGCSIMLFWDGTEE